MKVYERHPLSAAFPSMTPEAFKELIDDIDENGVNEKIVVYQGKILDGWHRYQACVELKVAKPPMVEFEGNDPVAFVLSKNLHRRHLSASVRAMVIARLVEWQEKVGRPSKSLEQAKKSGNFTGAEESLEKESGNFTGLTVGKAAELAGVGEKTMREARKATKAIEDVQAAVATGEMTVFEAAKLADKPVEEQKAALEARNEPKPKKQTPQMVPFQVYEELQKQFEELEDDYDTLATELDMAQKELAAVEAIRKNEGAQELMKLHQHLRSMTEARDQWQNKCAELTKQLNYLAKKK
jgi:hypothetical protein